MSSPREPQEASLAASAPQARTSARTALKKAAVAAAEADATPATGVGWKKAKAASSAASASPNESSDTRGDSHGDAAAAPAATLCLSAHQTAVLPLLGGVVVPETDDADMWEHRRVQGGGRHRLLQGEVAPLLRRRRLCCECLRLLPPRALISCAQCTAALFPFPAASRLPRPRVRHVEKAPPSIVQSARGRVSVCVTSRYAGRSCLMGGGA